MLFLTFGGFRATELLDHVVCVLTFVLARDASLVVRKLMLDRRSMRPVSPLTRAPWEARPNSTGASSKAPPRPRPLNSATASRNLTPGGQVPAPESSRRISDQGSARSLHEVRSTSALNPRSNSAQKQRHADHCARSQEACLAAESQRHQDVFLKRVAAKENRRKLDSQHRTPRTPSSPASTVNYENWDSSPVKLVRSNATEVEARCRSQSPLMRSVGHMGSGGLGVSRGGQKVKGQSTGSRVLRPHSHDESVGSRDEMSACGSITMLGSRSRVGLVRSRAPFGSSETRNLVRLVREPAEEMWTEVARLFSFECFSGDTGAPNPEPRQRDAGEGKGERETEHETERGRNREIEN